VTEDLGIGAREVTRDTASTISVRVMPRPSISGPDRKRSQMPSVFTRSSY
jgi:hypothetical protein